MLNEPNGWVAPVIPRLVHSWCVDGEPTRWSTVVQVDAITAVGPLETRTVQRSLQQIKIYTFLVCFPGCGQGGVPFCQESSTVETLEESETRNERFREEIIRWMLLKGSAQ
jgi:hypothetical protein